MRLVLLILGVASLLAMAAWMANYSFSPGFEAELGGKGFNEPTFSAIANAELSRGEQVRDALVSSANHWGFLFQLAGWVSLAATSIVTLLTGIFGKLEPSSAGRRSVKLIAIGLLSALASAATLGGSYAKSEAQVTNRAPQTSPLR